MGLQDGVGADELIKSTAGDRHNAQGMGEARCLGPMKREAGWPQLTDTAQALKCGGVNQMNQQGLNWVEAIERNRAMQGVMVGPA